MRPTPPIGYTIKASDEVPDEKVKFIGTIREKLNDQLNLYDYGLGLSWFQVYIVLDSNDEEEDFFYHNQDDNGRAIQFHLDFKRAMEASASEYESLASEAYLQAIDELAVYPIQDFKIGLYRKDVESLFEAQGWLFKVQS